MTNKSPFPASKAAEFQKKPSLLALAGETFATQFVALRDAAIPGILNQLAAISPANVCEANLRRAHEIYLLTAAVGILPNSIELADLRSIGEQCRAVGGPGVSVAQGLYQSFTGEALIENCDSTANRSTIGQAKIQGALMEVYPNPNPGGFVVQLPESYAEKDALLRITDAFGTEVQRLRTAGRTALEVNLASQPSGVYFVVLRNGADTSIRPVLVHH